MRILYGKEDFERETGLLPFLIDLNNEGIYCYNSIKDNRFEDKHIEIFSVHTTVSNFKNYDELLIFIEEHFVEKRKKEYERG